MRCQPASSMRSIFLILYFIETNEVKKFITINATNAAAKIRNAFWENADFLDAFKKYKKAGIIPIASVVRIRITDEIIYAMLPVFVDSVVSSLMSCRLKASAMLASEVTASPTAKTFSIKKPNSTLININDSTASSSPKISRGARK